MKVIIAGSRTITNIAFVEAAIKAAGFEITEVVSGAARGVDALGELWAVNNGKPIKQFRAAWDFYGRTAGSVRNARMAEYADSLIAVWDGKSKGTKNMIWTMQKEKKPVYIYNAGRNEPIYRLPELTTGEQE